MVTTILIVLFVYFGVSLLIDTCKADRLPCLATGLDVALDLILFMGVFHLMGVCL